MLERFSHFVILPRQVVIPKGLLYRVVQVLKRKLKLVVQKCFVKEIRSVELKFYFLLLLSPPNIFLVRQQCFFLKIQNPYSIWELYYISEKTSQFYNTHWYRSFSDKFVIFPKTVTKTHWRSRKKFVKGARGPKPQKMTSSQSFIKFKKVTIQTTYCKKYSH